MKHLVEYPIIYAEHCHPLVDGSRYVYNIPYDNATALEEALIAIKQNPIGSFVPETMQYEAMDDRVRKMMEMDWVGQAEARMAELGVTEAE